MVLDATACAHFAAVLDILDTGVPAIVLHRVVPSCGR
jgi:hypothetical protein